MAYCVKMVALFMLVATTLLLVTFDSIDAGRSTEEIDTEEEPGMSEHHLGDGHDHGQGEDLGASLKDATGPAPEDTHSNEEGEDLHTFEDETEDLTDEAENRPDEGENLAEEEHARSLQAAMAAGHGDDENYVHETCTVGHTKNGKRTHTKVKTFMKKGRKISKEIHHFVDGEKNGFIKRISHKRNGAGKILRTTLAHLKVKNGHKGHVHVHVKGKTTPGHTKKVKSKMNTKIHHIVAAHLKKHKIVVTKHGHK